MFVVRGMCLPLLKPCIHIQAQGKSFDIRMSCHTCTTPQSFEQDASYERYLLRCAPTCHYVCIYCNAATYLYILTYQFIKSPYLPVSFLSPKCPINQTSLLTKYSNIPKWPDSQEPVCLQYQCDPFFYHCASVVKIVPFANELRILVCFQNQCSPNYSMQCNPIYK